LLDVFKCYVLLRVNHGSRYFGYFWLMLCM